MIENQFLFVISFEKRSWSTIFSATEVLKECKYYHVLVESVWGWVKFKVLLWWSYGQEMPKASKIFLLSSNKNGSLEPSLDRDRQKLAKNGLYLCRKTGALSRSITADWRDLKDFYFSRKKSVYIPIVFNGSYRQKWSLAKSRRPNLGLLASFGTFLAYFDLFLGVSGLFGGIAGQISTFLAYFRHPVRPNLGLLAYFGEPDTPNLALLA